MVRRAFTLIELIISIVVISIIVGFYPILSIELNKSYSHAVEQNALFATTTRLSKITTAYWDENSYEFNATTFTFTPALELNNGGDPGLNPPRVGHFNTGIPAIDGDRRFLKVTPPNAPAGGMGFDVNDAGTQDDIDDFDTGGAWVSIFQAPAANRSYSYKENIWMRVTVIYVADPALGVDPLLYDYPTIIGGVGGNVKLVTIEARRFTVEDGNQTIFTMRTYSSNIGEIQNYASRTM